MYYESDYTFHKKSRIGDDFCDISQRNIQDTNAVNYMLTNYYPDGTLDNVIEFATKQPAINFKGSNSISMGGSNIDESSVLSITGLTRNKEKISLIQRPYVTVPYLGRGKSNAMMESQIQQPELNINRKSINPTSEISHLSYSQTPLIPVIKESMSNPENFIQDCAEKGWVRGGIPVRQMNKDR